MALIRSMLALQSPTPVRGLGAPLQRRPSPSPVAGRHAEIAQDAVWNVSISGQHETFQ